MEINLSGKTALVTGGNVGIGRAIALALARSGADVAITFFENDQARTADEIRAMGCQAPYLHLDATDSAQVNRVFAQAAQQLGGRIDILVTRISLH